MTVLTGNGPWFYQNNGSNGMSGTIYSFTFGGSYEGTDVFNGNVGSTERGTFKLDGNRIRLSTGGVLVFAVIDDTPIGYS